MTSPEQLNPHRRRLGQLAQILVFDLRAIYWWALLIPVIISAGIVWFFVTYRPTMTETWLTCWENVAVVVTGLGAAIAAVRWFIQRRPYWGWLAILAGVFFCRELHFSGTNVLVYTAPPLLLLVAWLQFKQLSDYLTSQAVVTMLVILGIFYTITQGMDAHLLEFIPDERLWEKGAEEVLEVIAHTTLVCLAIFSRPRRKAPDAKPAIPQFLRNTSL
ncbi:MAG: hypothetical protein KAR11_04435 [Phycisphaerae bacterium]|nr:hypothetical protein [Phycisphaerae bacterium]